jgi:four helix bundle protein
VRDYKKLNVWEKAHELAIGIYRATANFPRDEMFGLSSQMRRASVSIPSNIAEGCGRKGDPELSYFVQISIGSSNELEYQILLAHDLDFINDELFKNLSDQVDHVRRMLILLLKKTREG